MNRSTRLSSALAVILLFVSSAAAQITITQTDLQNLLLNSQRMEHYLTFFPSPVVDLGSASGSSQTFDFSGLPPEDSQDSTAMNFVATSGQPGASEFPGSNLCSPLVFEPFTGAEVTIVSYFRIQSDGFYLLGSYVRQFVPPFIDTVMIEKNSQPQILIPLPLTYGTSRTTTDTLVADSANGEFGVTTMSIDCDGWGDLTVPVVPAGGAPKTALVACLRATQTQVEETYVGGTLTNTETTVGVFYLTADGTLLSIDQPDTGYAGGNADVTALNYSYRLGPATEVRHSSPAVPEAFAVLQNYPNPFNPSTVIAFSVPATDHVSLRVFDVLGREVATLVDRVMSPGTYEATFDARGLPSGMYVYRIVSGTYVATKKMNVVK